MTERREQAHAEADEEEQRERYRELLEELRTILPGGQVLLAFLLTAPFSSRFEEVDSLGKTVFTVSLVAIATAVVLFFAPAAYHRLADRADRRGRLRYGVRLALAGMALIGIGIACAVFVVVRFMYDGTVAGLIFAVVTAVIAGVTWFVVPFRRRGNGGSPRTRTAD